MSRWKWIAAAAVAGWISTCGSYGQNVNPAPQPGAPETQSPADAQGTSSGNGKILFSRSIDDKSGYNKGEDNTTNPTPPKDSAGKQISATGARATPEEREALTFLAYDLDIRLVPRQELLSVKARMTVRNDSDQPLKHLALQLSSALKWEQVSLEGAGLEGTRLSFTQSPIDSDADHTGALNEALVTLPRELAPKAELKLEAFYSGPVSLTGARLERLGAPSTVAASSDWDRISPEFTGLRGFGNVVWYPVSAPPLLLGNGAKLFAEIGKQKFRQQQAQVSLKVTSEYTADGSAPNLAVLDGQVVPVVQTAAPQNSYPGVVTATLPMTVLGFSAPSFFLLSRQKIEGKGITVWSTSDDQINARALITAANVVSPLVQQWLGAKPRAMLSVVQLADPNDAPSEEGDVFFTGIKGSPDPRVLEDAIMHSLAHSSFHSPREWLNEGVPEFMGTLWIEQVQGRQAALEALESQRGALALAEPGTPGETGGEELIRATDAVYYRTKATYVLWMLRDLAGDDALSAALRAYVPAQDTKPDYFERLVEKASGKDLEWFFDAWVYHDRGLPDLSIAGVFPSLASQAGQYLVAVDLTNDGFAEAEVPVTLRSKDTTLTERIRIPARGKLSRRMLIVGLPTEIRVNDGSVPEVANSVHVKTFTPESNEGEAK